MVDFSFDVEPTKNEGGGGYSSNVDWDAYNNYIADQVGMGKQTLIGRVVKLYELGLQEREDFEAPYEKGKEAHEWALKNREGARLETRKVKGKDTECIVYPQKAVNQMICAVDFYEKKLDLGQFFSEGESREPEMKPYRSVLGGEWFKYVDSQRVNVVGRPFNLSHVNVNREKKGADTHYAIAKNSMLYRLADYCDVLDENENFHVSDITKLLGQVCMFEVELKWNEWESNGENKRSLRVFVTPQSRPSARDKAYIDSDLSKEFDDSDLGGILFNKENREQDLKDVRKVVKDTMKLATNYQDSVLQKQLEKLANSSESSSGGNSSSSNTPKQGSVKQEPKPQTPAVSEPNIDFDDDK